MAAVAFLLAGLLLTAAPAAADCEAIELDGIRISFEQYELVAHRDGREVARHELPVVGSAFRCIELMAFPNQGLLFVEWFGGAAGTSVIIRELSLLAFAVRDGKVMPLRGWLLHRGSSDEDDIANDSHRSYRLIPTDYGDVIVELTGTLRAGINGYERPHPPPWW